MFPKVVIIGRPNVGKSSMLNMLAGRRISIVDPTPGVTRDRVSTMIEIVRPGRASETNDTQPQTRIVELIDTGGYGLTDSQQLEPLVLQQLDFALDQADLILFVVDAQAGIVPLDEQVAQHLRKLQGQRSPKRTSKAKTNKDAPEATNTLGAAEVPPAKVETPLAPILVVANKVDDGAHEAGAAEASRLGFGIPVMVSAASSYRKRELLDAILDHLPETPRAASRPLIDLGVLLAVVGKRNAGKSTLVNALAGEPRMIVSELEGTTRDAVDVRFEMNGKVFTAIDTAGVRKTKSLAGDLEYYSQHRALRSVRRADVVLFLIDSTLPVSSVDEQLGMEIQRHFKPTVIVVNKWDLAEDEAGQRKYVEYLNKALAGLNFAPIAFISAKKSEGIQELTAMALNLHQQASHRVTTSQLNSVLEQLITEKPPTSGIGKRPKIYYVTQTGVCPPTIALFVNDPNMFDPAYQRYLINRFRDLLPYAEVPIQLIVRGRDQTRGTGAGRIKKNESRGTQPGAAGAGAAGSGSAAGDADAEANESLAQGQDETGEMEFDAEEIDSHVFEAGEFEDDDLAGESEE